MLHVLDFFFDELRRTIRNPSRVWNLLSKSERNKYLHTVGLVCSYFGHGRGASPKQTVQTGYDKIVDQYAVWTAESEKRERRKSVTALIRAMPKGMDLLDLGCGTGLPSTKMLAGHFNVTGVDFSVEAIVRAKRNVADARFMQKDITEIDFPPASFDVITAFYSIFHIPRRQQPGVIQKLAVLLRPGGIVVATMGIRSIKALFDHDWMGTQMYWSSFDSRKNLECLKRAGLRILSAREVREEVFGKSNTFLWVTAQKPAPADSRKEEIASDLVRLLEDQD
jgi:ubiquinone/menaquinone biosynthesis C-methylase UbiE